MEPLTITSENVDALCGPPNATEHVFDGHVRKLSFQMPKLEYGKCCATPIEDVIDLIPRDEWVDRIREKDEKNDWIETIARDVPGLDQNGLSYCHAYGTTRCMEVAEYLSGCPHIALSAESIGGPVTSWRNEGADPNDDLQQAITEGFCEKSYMDKEYSLHPNNWKSGWEENRKEHLVKKFIDLRVPGKVFDAIFTAAWNDWPCAQGFGWWSHFVSGPYRFAYDEKIKKFKNLIENNWGLDWPTKGADGYAYFVEGSGRNQGTPDWAFAIQCVKSKNQL
jgi:hypothetical protein